MYNNDAYVQAHMCIMYLSLFHYVLLIIAYVFPLLSLYTPLFHYIQKLANQESTRPAVRPYVR